MNNTRTSLIQKIISRGSILTPFEVIHLKYLSRKGILNDLINVERKSNPYIAAQKTTGIMSPGTIDFMAWNVAREDPDLYNSYNFVYEKLLKLDDYIGRLGYKGLALLTQLTSIRHEHFVHLVMSNDLKKTKQQVEEELKNLTNPPIMDFSTYSFVHQREVTFAEILTSFGKNFKYLIKSIDNILTLNYYLNQLIDLEDLECLQFLKMWLSDGSKLNNEEVTKPFFNAAYLCYDDSLILKILKDNHQNYVESIHQEIKNLPVSFGENSLQYVKDILKETTSK